MSQPYLYIFRCVFVVLHALVKKRIYLTSDINSVKFGYHFLGEGICSVYRACRI